MNVEWKDFLQRAGAEFDGQDRVIGFGNLRHELGVALTGTVFADLSHCGLLAVRGQDAEAFLQGQLTNDVVHLDAAHSQLNGYCSPKGRLLATFRVWRDADGFLLSLPREMVEPLTQRLQMFIMRSAVTLENIGDCTGHIGVSGPQAGDELGGCVARLPSEVDGVLHSEGLSVLRIAGVQPRYEIYGPQAALMKLWDVLNVRAAPVGAPAWGLMDIMAGLPVILPATADAFVPQMVNYQAIGGVSFKKGCYPGQEVVARMQYLGKLKRQMYLARVNTEVAPQPGDEVFSPEDPLQNAGKIVTAQPHPDGGYAVLAVVQISSREVGGVHLGGLNGPRLEFLDLPYPLAMPA
ncbi:MAG: folate-binding protein YgfZ [Gammaproteobacteria bacterium]